MPPWQFELFTPKETWKLSFLYIYISNEIQFLLIFYNNEAKVKRLGEYNKLINCHIMKSPHTVNCHMVACRDSKVPEFLQLVGNRGIRTLPWFYSFPPLRQRNPRGTSCYSVHIQHRTYLKSTIFNISNFVGYPLSKLYSTSWCSRLRSRFYRLLSSLYRSGSFIDIMMSHSVIFCL